MLIGKKTNAAINQQIGNEFAASLQYVSIASYFATEGLPVLGEHFFKQAEEERDHAMRFVKFLVDGGKQVAIPSIEAPKGTFQSAEEAVKLSLDREQEVTEQINALVDLAVKESDRITENFLQWFLAEQFEEVSSMQKLLKMIQRAGEDRLFYVEAHLSGSAVKPATEAQA